jgi:DNA repair exonuclease SbcCD ATPase subunit
MLLKRIKYHNFRPFIGDQEIVFSQEPGENGKNVTVILGQNTFGKSTFVLSFIWCLYGDSRFDKPHDILNKKIEFLQANYVNLFSKKMTSNYDIIYNSLQVLSITSVEFLSVK